MRANPQVAPDSFVLSGLRESVELFLWFLPGLLVWAVVAAFLSSRLATFLRTKRWVAFGLLLNLGLIVGATLTPTTIVLESATASSGQCDLSRLGPIPPNELLGDFDAIVNILLFVTFGFLLGLLPKHDKNLLIIGAAFLLTFVIELVQLLLPAIGRGCESADMVDNTIGLVIGLVSGLAATALVARRRSDSGPEPS